MKVVIVGSGKVGYTLTEQLSKEGHDVVVIDKRAEVLRYPQNVLDIMAIQGNGASCQVQKEAGVEDADLLIAVTSTDELNILCCLVAKKLGAKHTIARVRNPEYSRQLDFMKEELGLSMSVNPELAASKEIYRILRFPSAMKVEVFAKGRVELAEIKIKPGNPLDGQPLRSLYQNYKVKILVCAVQRGGEVVIPDGSFVLKEGDTISITAPPSQLISFFKAVGIFQSKARTVLIVGGGRIGFYLARQLSEVGIRVKVIEQDEARCRELGDLLPTKAMVIHGDGTEQELLEEEGVGDADAFVALTGIDEENIIISMFAKAQGAKKIVTKVNRITFLDLLGGLGIDSVISPKNITANQILRYVRAMQNSFYSSNVEALYKIVEGKAEALEFHVLESADYVDIPLKDLRTKQGLLIACIVRKGKTIIPGGEDVIQVGDSVIIVTTLPGFQDLGDILA